MSEKAVSTFGAIADKALAEFYSVQNASTTEEKILALEKELGGPSNFYAFGGVLNESMKLGCLEYEFLSLRDLVDLVLV